VRRQRGLNFGVAVFRLVERDRPGRRAGRLAQPIFSGNVAGETPTVAGRRPALPETDDAMKMAMELFNLH